MHFAPFIDIQTFLLHCLPIYLQAFDLHDIWFPLGVNECEAMQVSIYHHCAYIISLCTFLSINYWHLSYIWACWSYQVWMVTLVYPYRDLALVTGISKIHAQLWYSYRALTCHQNIIYNTLKFFFPTGVLGTYCIKQAWGQIL